MYYFNTKKVLIVSILTAFFSVSVAAPYTYAEVGEEEPAAMQTQTEEPMDTAPDEELSDAVEGEEEPLTVPENVPEDDEAEVPENETVIQEPVQITVSTAGEDGIITAVWEHVPGVDYYVASLDDEQSITVKKTQDGQPYKVVFEKTDPDISHTVLVRGYTSEDVLSAEGITDGAEAHSRNKLYNNSRNPVKKNLNLRTLLGEGSAGYSVSQGGCTDGLYSYHLMVSSYTQDGRILKLRVSDNAVVASSGIIDINHGNGMAIDTKRNRLVIIGREGWRNIITSVDADTLNDVSYSSVDYSNAGRWQSTKGNGLSAISYIEKYDCYVALQRSSHDLLVLNPDFKVTGFIETKITAAYPGTYQAMDADDRYVYLLLSYYSGKQPYNRILALDWNSENLLPGLNNENYVAGAWKCNNNGSGAPDADIRINTPYEAEHIYHIDQGDGTSRFYLAEYHKNPKTKYVTKKKAYKVKWKKVKKKVRVRKRVKKKVRWKKVHGKWKYKTKRVWRYKWKWKKVWKYKTKYKTVKVKAGTYCNRDNYLYDLGAM